jgi:WG containing repeat
MKTEKFFIALTLTFFYCFFISKISFSQYRYLIPYYENGQYGYCDTNLVVKIKPQFANALVFRMHYAFVDMGGEQINVIDTTGKILLPASYPKLDFVNRRFFSEIVMGEDNAGIGFVYNLRNQKLLNKGLDALFGTKISDFKAGRYCLVMGDIATNRGIYDIAAQRFIYITKAKYMEIQEDDGVKQKKTGREYLKISERNSNSFFAETKTGYAYLQNGIITFYQKSIPKQPKNTKSKPAKVKEELTDMRVDAAEAYRQPVPLPEIELYKKENLSGLIINEIKNNLIVKKDTLSIFYDAIILPNENTNPSNCCLIKLNNKWGVFDWKQKLASAIEYDTILKPGYNYIIVQKNKKSGLLFNSGVLLNTEYDEIYQTSYSSQFSLKRNNKYGYFENYYDQEDKKYKSFIVPCNYDLQFYSSSVINPVNAEIEWKSSLQFSLTGTPFIALVQKAPDYKFMYNSKFVYTSINGTKFYK